MKTPLPRPHWPHVFIARDSRKTSIKLVELVTKGLECMKVQYTDFGITTVGELHFLTANWKNTEKIPERVIEVPKVTFSNVKGKSPKRIIGKSPNRN